MPKVIVTKQRVVHTYAELWHASQCVLSLAEAKPEGSAWQYLSSLVLTAFSFEAYLNHVGASELKAWDCLERLSPQSKLDVLAEFLGVKLPGTYGTRPLQTLKTLLAFRNTIAHGKSTEIKYGPTEHEIEDFQREYHEPLLTDWEKLVMTPDFAVRARKDVEAVMRALQAGRKSGVDNLFTTGSGHSSASLL